MDAADALNTAGFVATELVQKNNATLLVGRARDVHQVMSLLGRHFPIQTVLGHVVHWQPHFGFLTVMPRPSIRLDYLDSSLQLVQQYQGLMLIPDYAAFSDMRQELIYNAFNAKYFHLVGGSDYTTTTMFTLGIMRLNPFSATFILDAALAKTAQPASTAPRRFHSKDSWQDDDSFDGVEEGLMDLPSFRRPR